MLSKLAGLWVNAKKEIMYSQASQITFICPMIFSYFPLDTQVETSKYVWFGCLPRTKMSCCQLSRIQTLYPIFKSVYLCTCHPLLAPQRRRAPKPRCRQNIRGCQAPAACRLQAGLQGPQGPRAYNSPRSAPLLRGLSCVCGLRQDVCAIHGCVSSLQGVASRP